MAAACCSGGRYIQDFVQVIAIFWSYDKEDYSIFDRVSAFCRKK